MPISKEASEKLNSMSFSQKAHFHTQLSPQNDAETESKRDRGPPVCTEVCLCVHKMRLDSYHVVRREVRFVKKAQKEGGGMNE